MFILNSNIEIGQYNSIKPHSVKVTKSVHSFEDKCVIKIPAVAVLKKNGELLKNPFVPTFAPIQFSVAKLINEGDKVFVELGYNGKLVQEFEGFVSRVNFTTPVEIECEGFSYQLRQNSYNRSFKKTTLREILEYLVKGTDIILNDHNAKVPITKFLIEKGTTGTDALESLRKALVNSINFQFNGNKLSATIDYLNRGLDVKYQLGYNVIKDNNLKLHEAKNGPVSINIIGQKNDGTQTYVIAGTHLKKVKSVTKVHAGEGLSKVLKTHAVTDHATLTQFAEGISKKTNYDGYEGKITCFLQPFCQPGYRAMIDDKKYPERSGNYLVESTEVTYGTSGARRMVEIGGKL